MPTDQEWMAELPAEQQPDLNQPAPQAQQPAAPQSDYAGQVAEIYSGKNIYKLPYTAEIPFKQQGKVATMALGKLLNAYNQHLVIQPKYDATLKELNTIRPEYETLKSKSQQLADLEKLQLWTEQNPEIFGKLWDSYTNREKLELQQKLGVEAPAQSSNGVNQQLLDVIAGLKGELGELKTWKSSWEQQQQQAEEEQNVKLIEGEIDEFKKSYPFLNIDTPDENGITLVEKIIKHGLDKRYPTFKVAALEYLEPQLLERFKEQGRTEAVKSVRDNSKQGIIATSNTPFSLGGQSPQQADAKKSDHVLLSEAKALYEQYKNEPTT
jgi:hypothetical protein